MFHHLVAPSFFFFGTKDLVGSTTTQEPYTCMTVEKLDRGRSAERGECPECQACLTLTMFMFGILGICHVWHYNVLHSVPFLKN